MFNHLRIENAITYVLFTDFFRSSQTSININKKQIRKTISAQISFKKRTVFMILEDLLRTFKNWKKQKSEIHRKTEISWCILDLIS